MSVHKQSITYTPAVETKTFVTFAANAGGRFIAFHVTSNAATANTFSIEDDTGLVIVASAARQAGATELLPVAGIPIPCSGVVSIVTTVASGTPDDSVYTLYWEE